jgi:hypothetical protein
MSTGPRVPTEPGIRRLWALLAVSIVLGCAAFRHAEPTDMAVYQTVMERLQSERLAEGMRVSAWLAADLPDPCKSGDLSEWAPSALPGATVALVKDYCVRKGLTRSLSPGQLRRLDLLLGERAPSSQQPRDIEVSPVGYSQDGRWALVFLRRQVAASCDVGEYYLLARAEDHWQVTAHAVRWIS